MNFAQQHKEHFAAIKKAAAGDLKKYVISKTDWENCGPHV